MKKSLTKIKLINWMYFTNTTIEVDGNIMITGNNSSGKSTIIDALQLLLIDNQKKVRFNIAAGDKTARTVLSYVRGQVEEQGKKYLRPEDVTSHIAIEIRSGNEVSIFGMVISISKGSIDTKSYHIENCFITDDLFIETIDGKKKVRPFGEFKSYIERTLKKTFTSLLTNAELKNKQKEVFGLDPEKYHNLLPKAIGFKSISSVEAFVNDFLLDDSKIEIDQLRENLQQIETLQLTIKQDERKLNDLNKISGHYYKLQDEKQKLSHLYLASKKLIIEKEKNEIIAKQRELENIEFNIQRIDKTTQEINNKIAEYESEKKQLENDIAANDATKRIETLREKVRLLAIEKETVGTRLENLQERLEIERGIISKLLNHDYKNLTTTYDYLSKGDFDSSEMYIELGQYKTYLDQIKENITTREKVLDRNISGLREQQKEFELFVKKLKKGERPYGRGVNELISEIKLAVSLKRKKDIDISPLCEHIDIKNEEWRMAIEGYLGDRKQYLVVEKDDYGDAIEVFDRLREKRKITGVGIIDVDKYFKEPKIVKGSLAEHLSDEFKSKLAHNYAISLLNEVQCVDVTSVLENYRAAITKEVMVVENNMIYRPIRELFELPLIGRNSITIQLELYEKLLRSVEKKIGEISQERTIVVDLLKVINKSYVNSLLDTNNNLVGSIDKFEKTSKEKEEVERRLRELENNSDFLTLYNQISELTIKIGKLKDQEKALYSEEGQFKERKDKTLLKKDELEKSNIAYKEEYDLGLESIKSIAEYNTLLDKYKFNDQSSILSSIRENEKAIQDVSLSMDSVKHLLRQSMSKFTYEYRFNAQSNEEEFYKYEEHLKRIRDEDLAKHHKNVEDFMVKNEDYLRNRVLTGLKLLIKGAEDNIKTINETLKKLKFGDQQYSIKFGPSKDKDFGSFYDLIENEDKVHLYNTMGVDGEANRYEAILRTFMNRLNNMISGEKYDLRDYRNYIDIDIEIKTPTGIKYLSKVKHSQSGGEGQVPFYIITAASFQNIMMKGRSKGSRLCLVLFDEAFNNMDAQRVSVMMSYFKELDIQVVLSLTSEKLHSIGKHVDTTIAIVREGEVADVIPFRGTYE